MTSLREKLRAEKEAAKRATLKQLMDEWERRQIERQEQKKKPVVLKPSSDAQAIAEANKRYQGFLTKHRAETLKKKWKIG